MQQNNISEIIITNFNDTFKTEFEQYYTESEKIWFNSDNLSIDEVREIIAISYQSGQKRVFIETKRLSPISQNGLLKIFEEPPKDTYFTLIVPLKSILLPTIRSRLPIRYKQGEREQPPNISPINLNEINLLSLNTILKEAKKLNKAEAQLWIELLFKENQTYPFSKNDLKRFTIASQLLPLGTNISRVYLMVLLPFVNRNMKNFKNSY